MSQATETPGTASNPDPASGPSIPLDERAPTPGETAQPILDQAQQAAAIADEQQAVQEVVHQHLQNRVVALNMEVRIRDQRLADLDAEHQGALGELAIAQETAAAAQAEVARLQGLLNETEAELASLRQDNPSGP